MTLTNLAYGTSKPLMAFDIVFRCEHSLAVTALVDLFNFILGSADGRPPPLPPLTHVPILSDLC